MNRNSNTVPLPADIELKRLLAGMTEILRRQDLVPVLKPAKIALSSKRLPKIFC